MTLPDHSLFTDPREKNRGGEEEERGREKEGGSGEIHQTVQGDVNNFGGGGVKRRKGRSYQKQEISQPVCQ